jgi:hypothetical protein
MVATASTTTSNDRLGAESLADFHRFVLEDCEDGRLVVDIYKDELSFHLTLRKWSVSKLKEYRIKFDGYLEMFKRVGFDCAYATPYTKDAQAQKLIGLFGFTKQRDLPIGRTVMKRSL